MNQNAGYLHPKEGDFLKHRNEKIKELHLPIYLLCEYSGIDVWNKISHFVLTLDKKLIL